MWNFLRLLPFFIGFNVPTDNEYWKNYICFLDVLDRLCASSFNHGELVVLSCVINDFFSTYISLYPCEHLKPKAHFIMLMHYPDMIRRFGPLIKTLRFESKNGQMKQFIANNKNKKNLCQSLAVKHQMLMYLHYKQSSLL